MTASTARWVGAALVAALLATACTIETATTSPNTTVAPATTTLPEGATTTLPPDPAGADSVDHLDDANVVLTEIAEVGHPVAGAPRSGSESLYVLEKGGAVREIAREFRRNRDGVRVLAGSRVQRSSVLDFSEHVGGDGPDQGAIGLAFSTDGKAMFVSYTNRDGAFVVDEYQFPDTRADPESRQQLLAIDQIDENNPGGGLAVGPDGFLYIGVGDTGGSGDPLEAGQDLAKSMASVLRVDIGARTDSPYLVPLGNPYYNQSDAVGEIWLKGVRNPRYLTFDVETGSLWLVDNGEEIEEINFLPAWDGGGRGANLGWSVLEGSDPDGDEAHTDPLHQYDHSVGCRGVGGAVYRGSLIPGMRGAYLFGDQCTGQIRAILEREAELTRERLLDIAVPPQTLTAIAQDADGELYVLTSPGQIYRVDAAPVEE